MEYHKTITLKDGRACTLRNGTAEDGQALLKIFNLTHTQTDYLLTYPEEHSYSAEDEAEARKNGFDGIIFNPGAYSHYSIALLDALKALDGKVPVIEVHLSNVHAREDFRKHLVTTQAATGVIAGFGSDSYTLALDALDRIFKKQ